jgi:hypothetical protein
LHVSFSFVDRALDGPRTIVTPKSRIPDSSNIALVLESSYLPTFDCLPLRQRALTYPKDRPRDPQLPTEKRTAVREIMTAKSSTESLQGPLTTIHAMTQESARIPFYCTGFLFPAPPSHLNPPVSPSTPSPQSQVPLPPWHHTLVSAPSPLSLHPLSDILLVLPPSICLGAHRASLSAL